VVDVKVFENDGKSPYERTGLKILVSVVRFRDPAFCFLTKGNFDCPFFLLRRMQMFIDLIIKGGPVMIPIIA
jgi:hypothetical protein